MLLTNLFDYNIWHTLFLSTEVFWPWTREPNCPSKFSTMDDFYFKGCHPSRHMELKAFTWSFHSYLAVCQLLLLCTSSQKPQPARSPFCFHSLLSKNNLPMYLPHGYICTSLRSRRPKDFGNQTRTVRKVRGRARPCVSILLLRPIWLVRLPRKLQQVWFLTLQALRVISIKFLLVISMLRKTEWSWELQTWSPKMNLLYILSTSPH